MNTLSDTSPAQPLGQALPARPRRLKIALAVHDLHEHGGHSLYTKILADELSRRHEVAVFANRCERTDTARWGSRHVRAWRGSALACVQTFPLGLRIHAGSLADYEIRHMQGYCGGRPNVVTAHICVTAYLASLRNVSLRHRLSLQLMAAAESRFYRGYDRRIIAISRKIADELQEFYKVRGTIDVIPHGVDVARFQKGGREQRRATMRSEIGIAEDETLALYVGDLTKSHAYLKELTVAAPDVQFAIVTYSQAYRWNGRNVHFLPPTSELEHYYAAADAFVFPTTYDAFGMVVLEAMASGLAIFSSDQAGAAELIDSGRDGFVTPLAEWVETTADRLRNMTLLQEVGRAAEESARFHDWSSVIAAVEKLYHEVAKPDVSAGIN